MTKRRRWALIVGVAALLLAVVNLWWVATHRRDYPFDIDEAGYTTWALLEYFALQSGGLGGWWDAVLDQAPHAPLLPALTSLTFLVRGGGVLEGFAVLSGFFVLLTLAVYGVGERLAGPRLGALAALLTATAPGAFSFSREYIFALPAAALLACAVYALLRSDGLRLRRWAIACGVALGLMLLARSMTIAFVPGVLGAGLLALAARRRDGLAPRILNLGLLVLTGTALAATWYAPNLGTVVDYLTSYGYGAQSHNFGPGGSALSWGRLREPLVEMTREDLFVPLAALLVAGLAAVAVAAVRRVSGAADRRAALRRIAESDALSVAIVVVAGYAALATSRNGGFGFTLPIAVLIPALAVVALRLHPAATMPALALLAAIAGLNVVAHLDVSPAATRVREVTLPGLGTVPYAGGMAPSISTIREQLPGPEGHFDESDREWLQADRAVVERLTGWADRYGVVPMTAFGTHSRILNTNTVQLAAVLKLHVMIPLVQLHAEPDDSTATYRDQLASEELFHPQVLLTMSRVAGDFLPRMTQARVEAAARQLGFERVAAERLPDGRVLRYWRKRVNQGRLSG
jgi:4-amino-4-deoxy-L-arabinose transferase-like glycosyltransferase